MADKNKSLSDLKPPEEFYKIINDFTTDILTTFPEYSFQITSLVSRLAWSSVGLKEVCGKGFSTWLRIIYCPALVSTIVIQLLSPSVTVSILCFEQGGGGRNLEPTEQTSTVLSGGPSSPGLFHLSRILSKTIPTIQTGGVSLVCPRFSKNETPWL